MKKFWKLFSLILVLAVLIAAAGIAKNVTLKKQKEQESGPVTVTIFEADPEALKTLSISNSEGTLSFVRTGDGWQVADSPEYPLDSGKLEDMLSSLRSVESVKTMENVQDLAEFGLEKPELNISVDGSELRLGNVQELDGYVYASQGDGNVYLVDMSLKDTFGVKLDDLLQMEQIPKITDLRSFKVNTPDGEYEIKRMENSGLTYSDSYEYFMKSGEEYVALDTTMTTDFINNVIQLQRDFCVDWNADEELMKSSGLTAPEITVTVEYMETEKQDTGLKDSAGETISKTVEKPCQFVLKLSGAYAVFGDSSMIYHIPKDVGIKLRYTTIVELMPEEVLALDFTDVVSADLISKDKTILFEKNAETLTDENGEMKIEVSWMSNGEKTEFAAFIDRLREMQSYGYAGNISNSGETEFIITFHRTNERYPETELRFCRYNSENCVAMIDRKPTVFVRRTDVEALMTILETAGSDN